MRRSTELQNVSELQCSSKCSLFSTILFSGSSLKSALLDRKCVEFPQGSVEVPKEKQPCSRHKAHKTFRFGTAQPGTRQADPWCLVFPACAASSKRARPGRGPSYEPASGLSGQTLQGSFSAGSKPSFASQYLKLGIIIYKFESSRRDLHNTLLCIALQSQFGQIFAKLFANFLHKIPANFLQISRISRKHYNLSVTLIEISAIWRNADKYFKPMKI